MQKLIEGVHRFQTDIFDSHRRLFQRLAKGQQPLALFITCSDSRVNPVLLTQTEPGELFILRNAGNIVPPYSGLTSGEAATIEYAVAVLKVKDIIICGHSSCGAMAALLHPEQLEGLSAVKSWLQHADATAWIIKENYSHVKDKQARLIAAIEVNVLVQLKNLRTHPSVAAAAARGDLELHGWTYKLHSGEVFEYEPQQGQFLPIDQIHANGREMRVKSAAI